MKTPLVLLMLIATVSVGVVAEAASAPSDRILAPDRYTSEKGRALGIKYDASLRQLNTAIYHCMPWLEVPREGIGFYKPRDAAKDDRYLSMRVYIEQERSTQFTAMPVEQRASSMFSRYVGPLLRRMTANRAILGDASVDGFTVILEWLKGMPVNGGRPVHETIAVFLDRPTAADYLQGNMKTRDLVDRGRVYGWDGETALGRLKLAAWDDNFVATYKVQNYQIEPGVTCQ